MNYDTPCQRTRSQRELIRLASAGHRAAQAGGLLRAEGPGLQPEARPHHRPGERESARSYYSVRRYSEQVQLNKKFDCSCIDC